MAQPAAQFSPLSAPLVLRGECVEGDPWTVMARPVDRVGTALLTGNVSAVDVHVFDLSGQSPNVPIYHAQPAVNTVVLGAAVVTADWTEDPTGYTVIYSLDPLDFGGAQGGRRYAMKITLTTVASATLSKAPKTILLYVDVRGVPE
jgi:hypothetical protein